MKGMYEVGHHKHKHPRSQYVHPGKERQGKIICRAQFVCKAIQSASQLHEITRRPTQSFL